MSYSFNIRAATKAQALTDVALKFDEVVAMQACHARDKGAALAAASAMVGLLDDDDESRDVVVGMSGYLSGQWVGHDVASISCAAVSVNASLMSKL